MLWLWTGRLYHRVFAPGYQYPYPNTGNGYGKDDIRGTNATTRYHKIIVLRHASCSLYYFIFVVGDDFNPLQLHAQGKAESGEIC